MTVSIGDRVHWTHLRTYRRTLRMSRWDGTVEKVGRTIAQVRTPGGKLVPVAIACLRRPGQKSLITEFVEIARERILPMVKLTRAEVLALQADDPTLYFVKCWRLYEPEPVLSWEGESLLYVRRTLGDRRHPETLGLVTPKGRGWAEGGETDVADDGSVVVEDYMLEIFRRDVAP